MQRLWTPLAVVGWLFLAVGCASLVRAGMAFAGDASAAGSGRSAQELSISAASGVVAAIGGLFLLRARNWARWTCAAWMGAHVVISLLHTLEQVLVHAAFLVVLLLVLWHPRATASLGAARR
jgi:hypothetical protein